MAEQHLVEVAADIIDGRTIYETLWAELMPHGPYRLVKTPLVAQGLAVHDEFSIDPTDKSFTVLNRGGNLGIQLFMKPQLTNDVIDNLAPTVRTLGGAFDSHSDSIAGFWIPATAGFQAVERLFDDFVASHTDAEWMFSNVYDENGQQLNWW